MLDGLPISLDHNRVPLRLAARRGRARLHRAPRCTRRSSARATRPRARTTSSRPARADAPRGRAARAGAGRAGPVRDNGRDRRGRPGRGPRPDGLPRRPLPVPGDADAPRSPRERETAMRRRWLRAALPLALAIAVAACGGTPGEDKPERADEQDAGGERQDRRLREPRRRHAECRLVRGLGRPARRDQGADASSSRQKYPNVTVEVSVPRLRELDQAGQARRRPATTRRTSFAGNQGYQLDGELVKAGPDPAARQVRQGLRLGRSRSRRRRCSSSRGPTTARRSARARCGASPRAASPTGVFANKKKLQAAGVDPASLKTFDDFDDRAGHAARRRCRPTSR